MFFKLFPQHECRKQLTERLSTIMSSSLFLIFHLIYVLWVFFFFFSTTPSSFIPFFFFLSFSIMDPTRETDSFISIFLPYFIAFAILHVTPSWKWSFKRNHSKTFRGKSFLVRVCYGLVWKWKFACIGPAQQSIRSFRKRRKIFWSCRNGLWPNSGWVF